MHNFWSEYTMLLQDGAHWAFELTIEGITAAIGFVIGRYFLRRHDSKVHGTNKER